MIYINRHTVNSRDKVENRCLPVAKSSCETDRVGVDLICCVDAGGSSELCLDRLWQEL
jgi:hypothetical protein